MVAIRTAGHDALHTEKAKAGAGKTVGQGMKVNEV